jgi:hypothetical protein
MSLFLTNEALCREDVWGSGFINPHILDLDTSYTSYTQAALSHPGKEPLDGRLGGYISETS